MEAAEGDAVAGDAVAGDAAVEGEVADAPRKKTKIVDDDE